MIHLRGNNLVTFKLGVWQVIDNLEVSYKPELLSRLFKNISMKFLQWISICCIDMACFASHLKFALTFFEKDKFNIITMRYRGVIIFSIHTDNGPSSQIK